ncbi:hypothetical protein GCM10009801_46640 [Streptomyces albiaxialis]|uniref:Uncharacterized protein n=1 Tax=Streptomyces albiaxialis TaxID=329523 RepID=A0ABN2W6Z8_9ACTN
MNQSSVIVVDLFLWLFAFMVARSREVRIYQVIFIALAGFLLGLTPFGYPVMAFVKTTFVAFGL